MGGKWIYLGQRNQRLTRQAFLQRWLNHRKLGAPPEMGAEFLSADYCAVQEDVPALAGISTEYDAVGVFSLKSLASIPRVAGFLKLDFIQADEKRFFDTTSEQFSIFCAEDPVRDGPDSNTAILQFLRRRQGIGPTDFARQWRESHGGLFLNGTGCAGVTRYVQNIVVAPPPPGFGYDGVAEFWFDKPESVALGAADLNRMMTDHDLIDPKTSFCVLTEKIAGRPRQV